MYTQGPVVLDAGILLNRARRAREVSKTCIFRVELNVLYSCLMQACETLNPIRFSLALSFSTLALRSIARLDYVAPRL